MNTAKTLTVFVASPNDVVKERQWVEKVVANLNVRFERAVRFRVILWESAFYQAHETWQTQIPEASRCDIVIAILCNKLGSPLPENFAPRLPDGGLYPSGTAYELLTSIAAAEATGTPKVYLFCKDASPGFVLGQEQEMYAATRERRRLDAFLKVHGFTSSTLQGRASERFNTTDEFRSRIDGLLRGFITGASAVDQTWNVDIDGSPFPGLRPFDMRHSRVFFGRDRKVRNAGRALTDNLAHGGRQFLLVVGPSGSGKSSLVRAGVIPWLVGSAEISDVALWRIAVMQPGGAETAIHALARALFFSPTEAHADRSDGNTSERITSDGEVARPESDPAGFGAALPELALTSYRTPEELVPLLRTAEEFAVRPIVTALDAIGASERERGGLSRDLRVDLILLVDQLEEIFARSVSDAERTAFARLLTTLVDTKRVWVIATLRADQYPNILDRSSPFLALKDSGGSYDLASPGEAELQEMLAKSAAACGLEYETRDEGLDEVMLRQATGDPLPLLQFALQQLFEKRVPVNTLTTHARLTFAAYEAIGGIDGAIETTGEKALAELRPTLSQEEIGRTLTRLLRRLARPIQETHGTTASRDALTAGAVSYERAAPDAAARALIDALARSRLLVLDKQERPVLDAGGQPILDAKNRPTYSVSVTVRLAHERVLTSWSSAREIVRAYRDKNAGIETDIAAQRKRWDDLGRGYDALLRAEPLARAEELVVLYGDELDEDAREFVRLSSARERRRRTQRRALTGAAASVLIAAFGFGLLALSAQRQAESTNAAAKAAADDLIGSTVHEFRNRRGIKSETIDTVFRVAEGLIGRIETNADRNSWFARQVDAVVTLIDPARPNSSNDLMHSRAKLYYQFARTYHLSANDLGQARERANQSLVLWERLIAHGDTSPEAEGFLALTHMELVDLDTLSAGVRGDFTLERSRLQRAEDTLTRLADRFPNDTNWEPGLARVLTLLGDLDLKQDNLEGAREHFEAAQRRSVLALGAAPDDGEAIRQWAWTFRKTGELKSKRPGEVALARRSFANEVCVRRRLTQLDRENILWAEDLGWALMKLGESRAVMEPIALDDAADAYYEALHRRRDVIESDRSKRIYYNAFIGTLRQLAALEKRRGAETLSDSFTAAVNDIEQMLSVVFPDTAASPDGKPKLSPEEARSARDRGVMSFIGASRSTIDMRMRLFEVERLPGIEAAFRDCWDQLIGAVIKTPVGRAKF